MADRNAMSNDIIAYKLDMHKGYLGDKDAEGALANCAVFSKCIIKDFDFSSYNLEDVRFEDCDISGCGFDSTDLNNTKFVLCDISGINFSKVTPNSASFQFSTFSHCDFSGSNFLKSWMYDCSFNECVWSHNQISSLIFNKCEMEKCVFENTDFTGTSFIRTSLEGAKFVSCDLRESSFIKSNCAGVDFSGSILKSTVFTESILNDSILEERTMERTVGNGYEIKSLSIGNSEFTNMVTYTKDWVFVDFLRMSISDALDLPNRMDKIYEMEVQRIEEMIKENAFINYRDNPDNVATNSISREKFDSFVNKFLENNYKILKYVLKNNPASVRPERK
jgi:fluoroquinolone resistance protein